MLRSLPTHSSARGNVLVRMSAVAGARLKGRSGVSVGSARVQ